MRTAQALLVEMQSVVDTAKSHQMEVEVAAGGVGNVATTAQAKLAEINEAAAAALAGKTQIASEQGVIATKSQHIEDARAHADKVRADIDALKTAATQSATETEGQRTRAQTALTSATDDATAIKGHRTTTETDATATTAARDLAKAASDAAKGLADRSAVIDDRVGTYEKRLVELEEQSKTQLAEITRLLPGATSAGLASEFNKRRETFLTPATKWENIFVGSLVALIVLAISGLWGHFTTPLPWDELARLWAARLPIAGALIWLALHASHESALAKRLEEDYGFKASTAASFQGFQNQMASLAADKDSALEKLCKDVLAIIGSEPGRIYDKHHLTARPYQELAGVVKELGANVKELVEAAKK